MSKQVEKQQNVQGVWKPFFQMLIKAKLPWGWVIVTFILSMGGSALQLLFPDYTEQIVNGDLGAQTIALFILVLLGTAVVNILSSVIYGISDAKINRSMRRRIWHILTALPIQKLEEAGAKELISRNTTDTNSVSMIFSSTLPGIVSTIYYVVGSVMQVNEYDSRLSVTMIGLVAVQLVLSFAAGRVVYGFNHKTQTRLAYLTEMVSEVMTNLPLVKIFTAENREGRRGRKAIRDYNVASMTAQTVSNAFYYASSLVNLLGTLLVIVMGGIMVQDGVLDLGEWIAYFMYYYYMTYDVQMLPYYWKELKGLQGTVRRLSAISVMEQEDVSVGEQVSPSQKDLKLEDVSFAYGEKQVLSHVSFTIPHGTTVALVGENGAGKSTLVSLLERFYRPDAGSIFYGESEATAVSLESWRGMFDFGRIFLKSGSRVNCPGGAMHCRFAR